jgi:hypothetical protein
METATIKTSEAWTTDAQVQRLVVDQALKGRVRLHAVTVHVDVPPTNVPRFSLRLGPKKDGGDGACVDLMTDEPPYANAAGYRAGWISDTGVLFDPQTQGLFLHGRDMATGAGVVHAVVGWEVLNGNHPD